MGAKTSVPIENSVCETELPNAPLRYWIPVFSTPLHYQMLIHHHPVIDTPLNSSSDGIDLINATNATNTTFQSISSSIFGISIITPLFQNISENVTNTQLLFVVNGNYKGGTDVNDYNEMTMTKKGTPPQGSKIPTNTLFSSINTTLLSNPSFPPSHTPSIPLHTYDRGGFIDLIGLESEYYPGCCMNDKSKKQNNNNINNNNNKERDTKSQQQSNPIPKYIPFIRWNLSSSHDNLHLKGQFQYFKGYVNRIFGKQFLPLRGLGIGYPSLPLTFNDTFDYLGPGHQDMIDKETQCGKDNNANTGDNKKRNKEDMTTEKDLFSSYSYPPGVMVETIPTFGYSISHDIMGLLHDSHSSRTGDGLGIGNGHSLDHLATIIIIDTTNPLSRSILHDFIFETAQMINSGSIYELINVQIHVLMVNCDILDQQIITHREITDILSLLSIPLNLIHLHSISFSNRYKNLSSEKQKDILPIISSSDYQRISMMIWSTFFQDYCRKNISNYFSTPQYLSLTLSDPFSKRPKNHYKVPFEGALQRDLRGAYNIRPMGPFKAWDTFCMRDWDDLHPPKKIKDIEVIGYYFDNTYCKRKDCDPAMGGFGTGRRIVMRGQLGVSMQFLQYYLVAMKYAVVKNIHPITRTTTTTSNDTNDNNNTTMTIINPFKSPRPPKLTSLYYLFNKSDEILHGEGNSLDWGHIDSYLPALCFRNDSISNNNTNNNNNNHITTKPLPLIFFENQPPPHIGLLAPPNEIEIMMKMMPQTNKDNNNNNNNQECGDVDNNNDNKKEENNIKNVRKVCTFTPDPSKVDENNLFLDTNIIDYRQYELSLNPGHSGYESRPSDLDSIVNQSDKVIASFSSPPIIPSITTSSSTTTITTSHDDDKNNNNSPTISSTQQLIQSQTITLPQAFQFQSFIFYDNHILESSNVSSLSSYTDLTRYDPKRSRWADVKIDMSWCGDNDDTKNVKTNEKKCDNKHATHFSPNFNLFSHSSSIQHLSSLQLHHSIRPTSTSSGSSMILTQLDRKVDDTIAHLFNKVAFPFSIPPEIAPPLSLPSLGYDDYENDEDYCPSGSLLELLHPDSVRVLTNSRTMITTRYKNRSDVENDINTDTIITTSTSDECKNTNQSNNNDNDNDGANVITNDKLLPTSKTRTSNTPNPFKTINITYSHRPIYTPDLNPGQFKYCNPFNQTNSTSYGVFAPLYWLHGVIIIPFVYYRTFDLKMLLSCKNRNVDKVQINDDPENNKDTNYQNKNNHNNNNNEYNNTNLMNFLIENPPSIPSLITPRSYSVNETNNIKDNANVEDDNNNNNNTNNKNSIDYKNYENDKTPLVHRLLLRGLTSRSVNGAIDQELSNRLYHASPYNQGRDAVNFWNDRFLKSFWLPLLPDLNCPVTFCFVCLNEWEDNSSGSVINNNNDGDNHKNNNNENNNNVIHAQSIDDNEIKTHQGSSTHNDEKSSKKYTFLPPSSLSFPSSSSSSNSSPPNKNYPKIPNTITPEEFNFFETNAPEIWKYELIYQYSFATNHYPHFQKLEVLWNTLFVHKDNLVESLRQIENDAIEQRMMIYERIVKSYQKQ